MNQWLEIVIHDYGKGYTYNFYQGSIKTSPYFHKDKVQTQEDFQKEVLKCVSTIADIHILLGY